MDFTLFQLIADEEILHGFMTSCSLTVLLVIIAGSIALLSKGADWLIDGAVNIAVRTGLSKIVIGATIVSLGTTLPEAFVSVMAAYMGNPGLALGNGVGSIIADTGLIFGLSCVLAAMPVNRFILNRTGWVQIGAACLLVGISLLALLGNGSQGPPTLERWVGYLFLTLLVGYLALTYFWATQGRAAATQTEENHFAETAGIALSWVMLVGGLILVIVGARLLVPAASEVAVRLGVPEDVIAATMVALGTSLPELITAVTAIRKGHPEITVGNIVGADVLNCLFVIGAAAAASPLEIPNTFFYFHFPAMLLILLSFRVFISANRTGYFSRAQGIWLLSIYLVYVVVQYTL